MASCAIHLKSKAYFIALQVNQPPLYLPDITTQQRMQYSGIEISPERDILKLTKEFAEHDYYGYASLIFFVNHYKMKSDILDIIYKYIKRNSTLKYVTKLVLNYVLDEGCDFLHNLNMFHEKDHPIPANVVKDMVKELYFQQALRGIPNFSEKSFEIMQKRVEKKNPFIDNLIVLTFDDMEPTKIMDPLMHSKLDEFADEIHFFSDRNSIQKLADKFIENNLKREREFLLIKAFSSAQFYIFNINPALAIVINHYSFSDKLKIKRVGSEIDIAALKRLFQIMKIPNLIVDDASLENVQTIMQKVQTHKFIGIKNFYIFIMSHGEKGDIIHTKTESYSIKDEIVLPLLENSTLADAQKFVIANACRGEIEYDSCGYYEAEVQEKIQKLLCEPVNPMYPQNEKLMMIYSTQRGYISWRMKEKGSIFVQELCESMAPYFYEKSMEAFCQETKKELSGYQIPDFQIDEHRPHTIKMEFANFSHYKNSLDDFFKYFKTHFKEYINADGTETDNDLYTIRLTQEVEVPSDDDLSDDDLSDDDIFDRLPYKIVPYYFPKEDLSDDDVSIYELSDDGLSNDDDYLSI